MALPESEVIRPYDGALKVHEGPLPADPRQAVAIMDDAARKFAASFPQVEQARVKGTNSLDPESRANLDQFTRTMRSNPVKPATIINLHPWELQFGSGLPLLRGIKVEACEPGMEYAYHYVRRHRRESFLNENAAQEFRVITPIRIAAEFVREFSNKDNLECGVIIYEGEIQPDKAGMVETYDLAGRPITIDQDGYDLDEEDNRIPAKIPVPIKRPLIELILEQRTRRNEVYLRKVKEFDFNYNLPDNKGKDKLGDIRTVRMMAEVLYTDGVLPKIPEWSLATRMEQGMTSQNCKACGKPITDGLSFCPNNHVVNPLQAYMDGHIDFKHVAMDTLTADEWVTAEEERAKRQQLREEAITRRREARKAEGKSEAKI